MPALQFTFDEIPDSRTFNEAPAQSIYRYRAVGVQDDLLVQNYALTLTPPAVLTAVGTLYRQPITMEPAGWSQYMVTVPYAPRKRETGSWTFNFDTTGGTVKITAAKEHIGSYPNPTGNATFPADPFKGAIGVKRDLTVEGTEIIIPALKLNVQFRHPAAVVSIAFAKLLARNTGKVNSAPFLDFDAGELLYLGSTGSDGSEAEAEVSYQFAASENADSLTIGEIASIVKKGHHYAWVEYKDAVSGGSAAVQPKRVHVERVYEEVDFASIFGWE